MVNVDDSVHLHDARLAPTFAKNVLTIRAVSLAVI